MSWFHDKIEVTVHPVLIKISGGLTVAIGDGIWRYLAPTQHLLKLGKITSN